MSNASDTKRLAEAVANIATPIAEKVSQDGRLFIPAGYMHKTEANIAHDPNVLITLGSSNVEGLHGMGAGFLIKGKARFVMSGPDFDFMKGTFSWLRATFAVTIETATQTW